jgi:ABC-2 type transport system ATP-binding protein
MDSACAIQAVDLTKYYDRLLAVDHVNFEVQPGEIFGFLGPNGAGKTTTLRMLNTLLEPTEGTARIFGYDVSRQPYQAKRQFGVVAEEANVYTEVSTWDNLMFTAKLYRVPGAERRGRIEELLALFDLEEKRDEKVYTLSKGMRQRLSLAMALVHQPRLLFCDEPVLGLDVQSTQLIKERLRELNAEGTTIFLTTHQIDMAEQLCDRVAIIHHGRIAAVESPERLKSAIEGRRSVEISLNGSDPSHYGGLAVVPGVTQAVKEGGKLRLYTADPPTVLKEVMGYVQEQGLPVTSINTCGPTLEDVFLSITGRPMAPPRHAFEGAACKNCPMHAQCESEKGKDEETQETPQRRSGLLRSSCDH